MTTSVIEYQKYLREWGRSPYHGEDGYTEKDYADHREAAAEEYPKYLKVKYDTSCRTGGEDTTRTLEDYTIHLAIMKTFMGRLINKDPKNEHTRIGKNIFKHLCDDFGSAITFSTASKSLHERAVNDWFVDNAQEFTLLRIKRGTRFKDFMKDEGWKDALLGFAELAAVAAIFASIAGAAALGSVEQLAGVVVITSCVGGGAVLSRRIPADAPRKTKTDTNALMTGPSLCEWMKSLSLRRRKQITVAVYVRRGAIV